jgi:DNA-binding transcriptional LysR family regulator
MEIHQLESFVRVAEEGSITRAAEVMHLTQPAVTNHVRRLERELRVELFERTGRGVRLTPAGEALLDYARRSLGLLEEGRQALLDLQEGTGGRLVLGVGVTTSIFHLPGWLRRFREAHPGVDLTVRTGGSRDTAQWVVNREIDLGIVTSSVPHPELCVRELFQEEIVLVTPPEHALAGRIAPPEELDAASLILSRTGTGFRDYLDRSLAAAGLRVQVKMESDSVEAIKSFVEVGLGISFLPAASVAAELETGALARAWIAGLPELKRQTSVVYRPERYLGTPAQNFLDLLSELYSTSRNRSESGEADSEPTPARADRA